MCDIVVVLDDGKIARVGVPTTVFGTDLRSKGLNITTTESELNTEISDLSTTNPTPDTQQLLADHKHKDAQLEDKARQKGDLSIYSYYLKSAGHTAVLLYAMAAITWCVFTEFPCKYTSHSFQLR